MNPEISDNTLESATNATADERDVGLLGTFSAYVRRPKPYDSGLVAQFFGENGDDADTITALSLTKFQDVLVDVQIFWAKDPSGQLKKTATGYPLICSFSGYIRRPSPMRDGMTAQFFAGNGEDADAVNDLGKTFYQDSLVFIKVFQHQKSTKATEFSQMKPQFSDPENTSSDIPDSVANKLTPQERKAIKKRDGLYEQANKLLQMSGFLRQQTVWASLGSEVEFFNWIQTSQLGCCAAQNPACTHQASPFRIPNASLKTHGYLPICAEHGAKITENVDSVPGGLVYLNMRHQILIQHWAWERLIAICPIDAGYTQPSPHLIAQWASEHKVAHHLPSSYLNKVM